MTARPLIAVCGTRPEAVKLAPVIAALRRRQQRVLLLATGQHPDLAPRMFAELDLAPDLELPPAAPAAPGSPAHALAQMMGGLATAIADLRPAMVVVQGDTLSTLAGALAGAYARVPVAHVEAGLRTGSRAEPFPEEMHRLLVTPVASLHFAPTPRAARALLAEGVAAEQIWVTGNSGIDALARGRAAAGDALLDARMAARFPFCSDGRRPTLIATVHRRENIGHRLQAIAAALATLAAEAEIILPLHPNPAVRQPLVERLIEHRHIHLVEPLDHAEMIWLMQRAALLLTDSGGLQEEAPSFGLRTLVLRRRTERMEAVDAGFAELPALEPAAIAAAARRLLALPALPPGMPFGDGRAAERIAGHIVDWLAGHDPRAMPMPHPAPASAAENPESSSQLVHHRQP